MWNLKINFLCNTFCVYLNTPYYKRLIINWAILIKRREWLSRLAKSTICSPSLEDIFSWLKTPVVELFPWSPLPCFASFCTYLYISFRCLVLFSCNFLGGLGLWKSFCSFLFLDNFNFPSGKKKNVENRINSNYWNRDKRWSVCMCESGVG